MKKQTLVACILMALTLGVSGVAGTPSNPEADYDRLDGMGPSGKKVNVIEWEGNLEIHVYPAGSLKGLALKLDKRNKNKPVMVIGYRFTDNPQTQLIRRAILGIPFAEGFKAYKDPGAEDYDKIIISNNTLSNQVSAFKLEPAPTELYPEGHPARAVAAEKKAAPRALPKKDASEAGVDEESGTIRPFFMENRMNR